MSEPQYPSRRMIMSKLPSDILFANILTRLPGKSLVRFKCVSKKWHSFLKSPAFTELHSQNHQKLIFLSEKIPCVFYTIDCEAIENGVTATRSVPFKVPSGDGKDCSKNIKILTSCNGLVCVGITNKPRDQEYYSHMILWNPFTAEYKRLSEAKYSHKECYKVTETASGLYYTASDDDYKLLRVTEFGDAYIYSLKSDSWRKLDSKLIPNLISESWAESTLLHDEKEQLYLLKKSMAINSDQLLSYAIVRFDTKTEVFTEIASPWFGDETATTLNSMLLHKDGDIHLCVVYRCVKPNSIELGKATFTELGAKLWRMDEDGDWTNVGTYPTIRRDFHCCEPLHLMRDRNWLTRCRSKCHVSKRDPAGDFRKISSAYTDHRFNIAPGGKYIDTLVSPNRRSNTGKDVGVF